jgi:hypothetical protein
MRIQVIYCPAPTAVLVALLLGRVYIYLGSEGIQVGRVGDLIPNLRSNGVMALSSSADLTPVVRMLIAAAP